MFSENRYGGGGPATFGVVVELPEVPMPSWPL